VVRGQRVGYIRVSSAGQNPARQLDGVEVDRVFTDTVSGKSADRPQLAAMLAFVRDGDTVIVHAMDRLARNLDDLRLWVPKTCATWPDGPLTAGCSASRLPGRGMIFGLWA
jgi:predicted site-specific integrase-resolvase